MPMPLFRMLRRAAGQISQASPSTPVRRARGRNQANCARLKFDGNVRGNSAASEIAMTIRGLCVGRRAGIAQPTEPVIYCRPDYYGSRKTVE